MRTDLALGKARSPSPLWPGKSGCQLASTSGEVGRMSDSPIPSGAALGMPAEPPLWKAALTWCEPTLVQELLDANVAYCAARKIPPCENPFPTSRDKTWNRAAALVGGGWLAPSQRRDAAVAKVDVDLRQRMASRQVILSGLKVKPEVASSRTVLSEWWADHLAFDWEHGTVVVYDALYVGVTSHAVQIQHDPPEQATGSAQLGNASEPPRRPVGRASYRPIIEAELAAHLRERERSLRAFAAGEPNQSQLATALEKRLKRLQPDKVAVAGGLPKHETIRKHVRDILALALGDKGGR